MKLHKVVFRALMGMKRTVFVIGTDIHMAVDRAIKGHNEASMEFIKRRMGNKGSPTLEAMCTVTEDSIESVEEVAMSPYLVDGRVPGLLMPLEEIENKMRDPESVSFGRQEGMAIAIEIALGLVINDDPAPSTVVRRMQYEITKEINREADKKTSTTTLKYEVKVNIISTYMGVRSGERVGGIIRTYNVVAHSKSHAIALGVERALTSWGEIVSPVNEPFSVCTSVSEGKPV